MYNDRNMIIQFDFLKYIISGLKWHVKKLFELKNYQYFKI